MLVAGVSWPRQSGGDTIPCLAMVCTRAATPRCELDEADRIAGLALRHAADWGKALGALSIVEHIRGERWPGSMQ
jgi:hypothetical protein